MAKKLFLFLFSLLFAGPAGIMAENVVQELLLSGWQQRSWSAAGVPTLVALPAPSPGLNMPVSFPGRQEFLTTAFGTASDWARATHLELRLAIPERMPQSARLAVFARDRDFLWRQVRLPVTRDDAGQMRLLLPIAGRVAEDTWSGVGHSRPWNALTCALLLEIGCAWELETGASESFTGTAELLALRLLQEEPPPQQQVYDLSFAPRRPFVGGRIEFSFRLSTWPRQPFSWASAQISAAITLPNGQTENIAGFYYEDFLYDASEWDKTRCLTPAGKPCYKLRYCPRLEGEHSIQISATVDGREIPFAPMTFTAREDVRPWPGFVRCDPQHKAFLKFDNGAPFWGLGVNVRSPFDNRYQQVAPYSNWQDMGLSAYEHLFRKYRQQGINVVEVWMSSWWLALEWINDAPGFHGVGHYNQYRAWMLDYILKLAEENDIYLILALNNHGKFGMVYDTEWERNPYNVNCGGFLEQCEDFYTSEKAKEAFRNVARYIVSRWGASDHLLTWKLFTEVDLTGPTIEFYHHPSVAAWHAEMGAFLKSIDIYQHPVNTHWMLGYHRINDAIATLPELDFLTTDAYYSLGGGTQALVEMLRTGVSYARKWAKPMVITEFGGSSYADSMGNLMRQVEIGLWTGLFNESAILPLYWWFALLEDKDLYQHYRSISRFAAHEDRRGLSLRNYAMADAPLSVNEMYSADRYYAWLFDTDYFYSEQENLLPQPQKDRVLTGISLAPGDYTQVIWDCQNGNIREQQHVKVSAGGEQVSVRLPEFTQSIAVKITPLE